MPAHAKEVDNREKYGLWIVWAMVIMVGVVSSMLAVTIVIMGNLWIGLFVSVLVILCMTRLVIYTRDLIKATA